MLGVGSELKTWTLRACAAQSEFNEPLSEPLANAAVRRCSREFQDIFYRRITLIIIFAQKVAGLRLAAVLGRHGGAGVLQLWRISLKLLLAETNER